jgi:8-oxo-dGTP pyrophosphatase MutT (NUDIX family)
MSKILHVLYMVYTKLLSISGIRTSGVRVILTKDTHILLVKPRYYPYWTLPGGGIKKGESTQEAGRREVAEECGIAIHSFSTPLGEYVHTQEGRQDTVAVLVGGLWGEPRRQPWSFEIQKSEFFDMHDLPINTSESTKKRVGEFLSGKRGFHGDW